jgi:hypothetical protein
VLTVDPAWPTVTVRGLERPAELRLEPDAAADFATGAFRVPIPSSESQVLP